MSTVQIAAATTDKRTLSRACPAEEKEAHTGTHGAVQTRPSARTRSSAGTAMPKTYLRMTPDRWIKTSPQRTQILYRADTSLILYFLEVRHGHTLIESGTGTLGLTYVLGRAVGPSGAVHTVEQNAERYAHAKKEIEEYGLANTSIHHGDIAHFLEASASAQDGASPLPSQADGIVLDVPAPEGALGTASRVLRPNGRLVCFVPCIEQVQRILCTAKGTPSLRLDRIAENTEIPHRPFRLAHAEYGTVPARQIRGHTGYLVFLSKKKDDCNFLCTEVQ
ncbi:tRNA (adenine57-N1/adenine58-N1)-methyltransferase catalytic subunit [Nematocida sp. AWRm77]|nr:tRNA (adenine57-N1/adenine58-N1)-methyltransferase catalytic subunit [Nematocida sp. AWRm77]